jgi:hypothetical protein
MSKRLAVMSVVVIAPDEAEKSELAVCGAASAGRSSRPVAPARRIEVVQTSSVGQPD